MYGEKPTTLKNLTVLDDMNINYSWLNTDIADGRIGLEEVIYILQEVAAE